MAKRKRKGVNKKRNGVNKLLSQNLGELSGRPVLRGLVSPQRSVPPHIKLPPYALDGLPPPPIAPPQRTPSEIAAMKEAGELAAEVLLAVSEQVAPGVTTDSLDSYVHEAIIRRNAYPSPLNYRGFPKSVCTSVNEVICHGIPDSRPLEDGDIINIDVTAYYQGVHGDTSAMFLVGDVDADSRMLVRETLVSLQNAIGVVRPGSRVFEIGRAIEQHARKHKLGVVREFIGHGVGAEFHGELQIPHYYDSRHSRVLQDKMTFTIEPMLTLGSPGLMIWDDDWTAVTLSGQRSAQFEHTLLVTGDGVEILTRTAAGECAHDQTAEAVGAPVLGAV